MNTPVLILAHQRPEQLRKCLAQLSAAGATRFYASVDGAPLDKETEQKQVLQQLQDLDGMIDIQILPKNMGCNRAVNAGLNWFFEKEEFGIVIEEDVLISGAGLTFLENMLNKYQQDKSVFMAGAHLPTQYWNTGFSHHFSRIGHIWGWATWRDRWQLHSAEIPDIGALKDSGFFKDRFGETALTDHVSDLLELCENGNLDTWDLPWGLTMLEQDGLCALPSSNQIKNIGIGPDALHTTALHTGVCNRVQHLDSNLKSDPKIWADRTYEHEWHRRLKGETAQLRQSTDQTILEKNVSEPKTPVLLINTTDKGGGAERICLNLMGGLSQDSEVKMLVAQKKTNLENVFEIQKQNSLFGLKKETANLLSSLKEIRFSEGIIHLHNIHGMDLKWSELMHVADSFQVVWTLHDLWTLSPNEQHPFTGIGKIDKKKLAFLRHSNVHLTTPSLWLQDRVYQKTNKLPWLINNGIDVDVFQPENQPIACEKVGLNPNRKKVLFLSKNPKKNPYKDFKTLKMAWQIVNDKLGKNGFDLVCLGGESTTEKVGSHTLTVLPITYDDERIAATINACDVVVHASKSDNSPLAILEAMACKIPVVATSVGGINELLLSGKAGTLVQPNNAQQLAEAILEVDGNSKATQLKVEIAFRKIQSEHTLQAMTESYLGLYSVLNK